MEGDTRIYLKHKNNRSKTYIFTLKKVQNMIHCSRIWQRIPGFWRSEWTGRHHQRSEFRTWTSDASVWGEYVASKRRYQITNWYSVISLQNSGVPRNFVRGGGVQQIQL